MTGALVDWARAAGMEEVHVWDPPGVPCVVGTVRGTGRAWTLMLALPEGFPYELPLAAAVEPSVLGRAHVLPGNFLCWAQPDALVDPDRPGQIVRECIQACVRILEMTDAEERGDILREVARHWAGLPGAVHRLVCLASRDFPRRLFGVESSDGQLVGYSTRAEAPVRGPWRAHEKRIPAGLAVRVPAEALSLPPRGPGPGWLQRLISCLDAESQSLVSKFLRTNSRRALLLLMVPSPDGGETAVGVEVEGPVRVDRLRHASMVPVVVSRCDRWALWGPSHEAARLRGSRVAVVGCGSVGGRVAVDLAGLGVGKLTLVDPDVLTVANASRHVLGLDDTFPLKVHALREHLAGTVPHAAVASVPDTIRNAAKVGTFDPLVHNAVVIAVDDPKVALWLNAALRQVPRPVAVVTVWLEAMGIGVHSMRSGDGIGCFECLFRSPGGGFGSNRAHLSDPGNDFRRELDGCGGVRVPFSGADAAQASALAVRQVVEALAYGRTRSELVTLRGDVQSFQATGWAMASSPLTVSDFQRRSGASIAVGGCSTCG